MSAEENVLKTPLEWADLQSALQHSLGTNATFGLRKRAELIGYGQGFMSVICRVHAYWTSSPKQLPERLIVKIPSENQEKLDGGEAKMLDRLKSKGVDLEEYMKEYQANVHKMHNAEVAFYKIASTFKFKVPKTYVLRESGEQAGVIAMEDISNTETVPIFECISVTEAQQVLEALAEVHAFSLKNDHWKAYSKVHFRELSYSRKSKSMVLDMCKLVTSLDKALFEPLIANLEPIINEIFDIELPDNLHLQMGLTPVLVHGDLWSSSLLWQKNGNQRQLAAITDWQIAHQGCAAEDICRLICSTLSGKTRRQKWEGLLTKYYMALRERLGFEPPFTLQQLKESYVRLAPFEMVLLLATIGPLITNNLKKQYPSKHAEYTKVAVEKAQALFEDLFQFHEMNVGKRSA